MQLLKQYIISLLELIQTKSEAHIVQDLLFVCAQLKAPIVHRTDEHFLPAFLWKNFRQTDKALTSTPFKIKH